MSKKKVKNRSSKLLKKIKGPAGISVHSFLGDVQGCGTIRVIYPYLLLNHFRYKKIHFASSYSSYFIRDVDFYKRFLYVQFQRAATKDHLNLFKVFHNKIRTQTNTPLIYEIDDLLIGIPEWNYAHDYYKQCEPYIKEMLSMVDGIITSTERLSEVYSEFNKNITVIPNHLPKFIWGDIYPKHYNEPREKKPRILWAGSQNHFSQPHLYEKGVKGGDFGSKMLDFIRKTTDKYQWIFSGGFPIELEGVKNKIETHKWVDVFNYPRHLKDLDADICVAPLIPCLFNDSKSNINML
jgi:hypothetical protein